MALRLKDIQKIILKAIDRLENPKILDQIGEVIKEDVKTRTRLGRGVPKSEGPSVRLKALEPQTKTNRKNLKKKGQLTGPGATPAKSGLNRSGQMLDSLKVDAKNAEFTLSLDAEGTKKAELVSKIDPQRFTFMNLSKSEVKRIVRLMEEEVKKVLK